MQPLQHHASMVYSWKGVLEEHKEMWLGGIGGVRADRWSVHPLAGGGAKLFRTIRGSVF